MSNKYKKYIPWITLAIVFIFTILLNYYVQWRCLDSDMASEMVLANLLNKEGKLVTDNWYYSSEVRVICEQIWFQLGLLLSPNNWRIARLIGHSINLAILIISFIFLLYSTSIKEKGLWIAIVLLLPFDFWYLFHVLYGGFYICHTVALFTLLGLLLRYINNNRKIYILLLFIFGIIFGLNGIKVLMYFTAPCLLTLVVLSIYKYITKKQIDYYRTFVVGTIVSTISTLIGVGLYSFVICRMCGESSGTGLIWGQFNINNILLVISNYLQMLGFINNDLFITNIEIVSLNGILGIFGLINAIVFIIGLITLLKNKYYSVSKNKLFFIFILCSFITGVIMFALTQIPSNGSYWLPFLPFGLVIIEMLIEHTIEQGFNTKYLRIVILVSFILCSYVNNDWYLKNNPRGYKGLRETTQWLKENGCKNVIAEFWVGNAITEYSDGEIEAFIIHEYGSDAIEINLQAKDHTTVHYEKGAYVVIPIDYEDKRDLTYYVENGTIVKSDDEFIIYMIK